MATLATSDSPPIEDAKRPRWASTAVLGTTELLEQILLQLPLNRLLIVQSVSRSWQATVHGSLKAQQALFFQPFTSDQVTSSLVPATVTRWSWLMGPKKSVWVWNKDSSTIVRPTFNPLLHGIFFIVKSVGNYEPYLHLGYVVVTPDTPFFLGPRFGPSRIALLDQLHRSCASWRSMVVMQPSCARLEILFKDFHRGFTVSASNEEKGVTMQDVFTRLRAEWIANARSATRGSVANTIFKFDDPTNHCWGFRANDIDALQTFRTMPTAEHLLHRFERIRKESEGSHRHSPVAPNRLAQGRMRRTGRWMQ